jgi:nucleoside-diphosphate-sugar epimerase
MRALVTGAGGFIGANLVRYLLAKGHEPLATVRPDGLSWRLDDIAREISRTEVDLRDAEAVQRLVGKLRPDVIFHLAAHGAYSWQDDLQTMLDVNVRCTAALLAGARSVNAAMVHAGSSSEYGYKNHPPREDEFVEPNSTYAVTKVTATHLCRLAAAGDGMRAVTLRLYSIYGDWEEPGRLMPALVTRCLQGAWPPLVGPDTARDFVWVKDACDAFLRAATIDLKDPGAVLNIASGTQTTLGMLVDTARAVFGVAAQPQWGTMTARRWDTSIWVGDPTAAANVLGWKSRTSLADGLARMGSWLAEHSGVRQRYCAA